MRSGRTLCAQGRRGPASSTVGDSIIGHPRPSDRGTKGDGAGAASLGWQDRIRPISYVDFDPRLHPNREPAQILTPTPTAFWPIDGHRHRAVGRSARVAATPFSLRPHARRDTHTALTPMMMRAPEEYAKQKSRRPSPRSQSAIIAAAHIRRTRAVHARPAFCCLSRSLLARAGGLVLLDTVMSAQNLSVGRRSAPGSVLSDSAARS